jgi:3-oxoacyl-[acyl-carrier protein] reductase
MRDDGVGGRMKVVLVTGGTRGIGRAVAAAFRADHRVAVTWRTSPPQAADADDLAIRADLRDAGAAAAAAQAVIDRFGRLDVIVNNAGMIAQSPLEGVDPAAALEIWP